jgi:hypothetical protein
MIVSKQNKSAFVSTEIIIVVKQQLHACFSEHEAYFFPMLPRTPSNNPALMSDPHSYKRQL